VALDSDFLMNDGAGAVRHTRELAQARGKLRGADMVRLYAVESSFSVTGAMADHRLARPSGVVSQVAVALARALDVGGALPAVSLDDKAQKFVDAVAKDLRRAGGNALLVAGEKQPAAVHALVHAANVKLGAVDKTVSYVDPFDPAPEGAASIMALAKAI